MTGLGAATGVSFQALGMRISVHTVGAWALVPAQARVRDILADVDRACSRFRPDSELAGVHFAEGRPVAVSPLLFDLLDAALWSAGVTGGAADPTVGTAVASLGYDRDFAQVAPSGPALARLPSPAPGWGCIELDRALGTVRVPKGVVIDLGSSAKAFAADWAATEVAATFGTGALVNLGGDIAVAGEAPEGGWAVGLALDSATAPEETAVVVSVRTGGLASSGTAVRTWKRGERRLHHIIDPRTGYPAESPWVLASVAAGSCLLANAASTASVVLGEEAVGWLESEGLPARLVRESGEVETTGGWPPDQNELGSRAR